MSDLPLESLILFAAAAFGGGIASGLVGFGVGAVAMVIWLHFMQPVVAVPLMALCALPGQLQTLRLVWGSLNWKRLAPILGAAFFGVPVGAWLLMRVDPQGFRIFMGFGLAAYAGWRLLSRRWSKAARRDEGGALLAGAVGFVSGFFGGFAGLTAPTVSLWASLHGWGKDEQRAVYQPLMIAVAVMMLGTYAVQGLLTWQVLQLSLLGIPVILAGTFVGIAIYRRLNDMQFETVILLVILVSGLNLALRSL